MTLKEKFKIINCTDCDMPYCDIRCTILAPSELDKLEQIADEFAIGFADWCCSKYTKLHSVWCPIFGDQRDKNNWKTTKELLEIYKKEKGLCD